MRLVRIAREKWDVLAVLDSREECQVLDFLADLDGPESAAAGSMVALLKHKVPKSGPPRREPSCKSLGDGVYEFRRQPKGKKLRVLWFYGGTAVIVCTAAFKKAERTPRAQLDHARFLCKQYWIARSRGELEILDPRRVNDEP
jgi:phage-related protein